MKKGYVISTVVFLLVMFVNFSPSVFASDCGITHLLVKPSQIVALTTQSTPTWPDETVPINRLIKPDGTYVVLDKIPDGLVLIVTDVNITIPAVGAPAGRYKGVIRRASEAVMSIELETSVDGFQKTFSLTSGMVFTDLPEFEASVFNPPAGLLITIYGYYLQSS